MCSSDLITAGDIETGLRMFLDGVAGAGAWSRADELLRTVLRDNARTLIAMSGDSSEPMTRAMAQSIRAPTLLIGGEGIPAGFVKVLDALESCLPDARRARIDSNSHFANLETPAVFNDALEAFLSGAPASRQNSSIA